MIIVENHAQDYITSGSASGDQSPVWGGGRGRPSRLNTLHEEDALPSPAFSNQLKASNSPNSPNSPNSHQSYASLTFHNPNADFHACNDIGNDKFPTINGSLRDIDEDH